MHFVWKWTLSAGILSALVVSELYYREPLFIKSELIIQQLQQDVTQTQFNIWHYYSDIALGSAIAKPILITFA